jgi:Transglycosylase SLT domain.
MGASHRFGMGLLTLAVAGIGLVAFRPRVRQSQGIPHHLPVAGIENTSPEFRAKLVEIAISLGVNPVWLAAIISFESAGTFSSSIRNSQSGATGLIQFMPSTARRMGTTTAELAALTPEDQLDYVRKYFEPWRHRLSTLSDLYMAVLWPRAIGQPDNYRLFKDGSVQYAQNRGLDVDGKGYVTKADASRLVDKRIVGSKS